jgi:hypothetical protein
VHQVVWHKRGSMHTHSFPTAECLIDLLQSETFEHCLQSSCQPWEGFFHMYCVCNGRFIGSMSRQTLRKSKVRETQQTGLQTNARTTLDRDIFHEWFESPY